MFIKNIIIILLFNISNIYAVVPSPSSNAGKILSSGFDNFQNCFLNFGIASDIPGEYPWCILNDTAIVTAAVVAATTLSAATGPAGIALAAIPVGALITSYNLIATAIAGNAHICRVKDDVQPDAYTDNQIIELLKRNGDSTAVENIQNKYDKICVEYMGSLTWFGANECKAIGGATICAFSMFDPTDNITPAIQNDNTAGIKPEYLCARVSSTCPCIQNLSFGTLNQPSYVKDKNGHYVLNADSTLQVKDEDEYKKTAAAHCRILRTNNNSQTILPVPYTGIIDDVCNTWSGYSKNSTVFSAGIVQCFEHTMRNLFEKPMPTSNIGITLTPDEAIINNQYVNDSNLIQTILNHVNNINKTQNTSYDITKDLNIINEYIPNIVNLTALGEITGPKYQSISKSNPNLTTVFSNAVPYQQGGSETALIPFHTYMSNLYNALNMLSTEIINNQNNFIADALSTNAALSAITPFRSLQGKMQAFVIILVILFVMMMGYRIIDEKLSPNIENIVPEFIKIALVYYFAMGNAWRDYFLNMILHASKGLGQFAMEITRDYEVKTADRCNFMDAFYIPSDSSVKCEYPNLIIPDGKDKYAQQTVHYNLLTNSPVKGCIKGPFIPRPNYEAVYIPVQYSGVQLSSTPSGNLMLQVYCFNDLDTQSTVVATLQTDSITGVPKRWMCPVGYTMEDGYRVSELLAMGIDTTGIVKSSANGVINTSINIINPNGVIVNIVEAITDLNKKALISNQKSSRILVIEQYRGEQNKTYRNYPIIQQYGTSSTYGVSRNMDYVGMFDTLDCKIMRYFMYDSNNSQDVLGLKFLMLSIWSGPLGIAVALSMMFVNFLLISMIGRIVQGYLISIGIIMILLYLSPLIVPCILFKETVGFYNNWLNGLKKYATGIPVSLLVLGIVTILTDYVMYGSPLQYSYFNVFNPDGTINQNCGQNDMSNAPLICLINVLNSAFSSGGCILGTCVNTGGNFWKYLGIFIMTALQSIIVLNIIIDSLGKIESFMNNILGTSQDTEISGSIFNTNTGLFDKMKNKVIGIASGAAKGAVNLGKKGYNASKSFGSDEK